jgi:ABC-type oligopeptide transport system substrate-binding subunit
MYLLYEPLFSLDDNGKVHEAAAEEYHFDKETGDLYITLRESYWTSGDRVIADDFIYAWRRIISPENSFTAAPLLYDIKNAKTIKNGLGETDEQNSLANFGAVAVDSSTIRISFESADVDRDAFLRNLTNIALAPLNRTCIQGQEDYWSSGASTVCYTNGPFKIRELDNAAGYFTLIRHTDYHRAEDSKKADDYYVVPKMLRTVWNIDDNLTEAQYSETLLEKMNSAAADTVFYMSALSLDDRKAVASDAVVSDSLSTYTYVFDTTNPLFSDARVRVILSQVIDRNAITELVTFGRAATGFISYGVWDSTSSKEKKSFRNIGGELISTSATLSVTDAKAQLDSLNAPRGKFTLTFMDREEDLAIATYVAELWGQLGYTVKLEPVSYYEVKQDTGGKDKNTNETIYSTYHVPALQKIYNGDSIYNEDLTVKETLGFDVIAIDYQMFSTNALTALASLSTTLNGAGVDIEAYNASTDPNKTMSDFLRSNAAGYANEAYDALITAAAATADLKARAEILHQAEQLLLEDMPVIPLLFNQSFYVVNKKLTKLDVNYYGFTVFTRAQLKNYRDYFLS